MSIQQIKRLCLRLLVSFLSLSALIAVISLLAGDFGGAQFRVILTNLAISGASICAMACFAFIEKRGHPNLGGLGAAIALIAAIFLIVGFWKEYDSQSMWKVTFSWVVLAAAFAHSFLLLIPMLDWRYRWSQTALVVSVSLLAGLILLAIWVSISSTGYYRFMGVVAIVVGLLTLVVPICARLSAPAASRAENLILHHEQADIYRDSDGQRFRVSKV